MLLNAFHLHLGSLTACRLESKIEVIVDLAGLHGLCLIHQIMCFCVWLQHEFHFPAHPGPGLIDRGCRGHFQAPALWH